MVISDTHISNDELKVQRLSGLIQKINDKQLPGVEMLIATGDANEPVYYIVGFQTGIKTIQVIQNSKFNGLNQNEY